VGVFGDGLGAGADVKFFVHPPHVSIDGWHANVQSLGDFLVKISARQQFEHFLLAGLEFLAGWDMWRRLLEGLNDFTGDIARHW